jgi:acyl-CoA reductase-like NAD-dependent aldehyde dehydrogenase
MDIPAGCADDANRAVASARSALDQGVWSRAAPSVRKTVLHRFADLIGKHATELDRLDAEEMGKPVSMPFANAASAANYVRFYAEALDKITGDVLTSDRTSFSVLRRVPRGVVAAIIPWNFPTYNTAMKAGPALAAGNCLVLKPSELASRSVIWIAHLALEAGLPAGVFNVVPGTGERVGKALALHKDVDMIAFTGSSEVGRLMLQYAGQSNMKVVMAECGGKSPHIVCADGIDVAGMVESIASFILMNQGQLCTAGSRLLVQREVESQLLDRLRVQVAKIVPGDALDPKTTFGPLATEQRLSTVMKYIEVGLDEGAELVTGGTRLLEDSGGYYVAPTVLRNVQPASKIAQEEIFGPVLTVTTFENTEEAIRLANATPYGLAAYAWTRDLARSMKLSDGIRSAILVNACAPAGEGPGHAASNEPCGQSGTGVEGGMAGLGSYLRRQLVWFNYDG